MITSIIIKYQRFTQKIFLVPLVLFFGGGVFFNGLFFIYISGLSYNIGQMLI